MIEAIFAVAGATVFLLGVMRWYIGAEVERQIEQRWQSGLSRHSSEIERLKQRRALAEIAAKQAEERLNG